MFAKFSEHSLEGGRYGRSCLISYRLLIFVQNEIRSDLICLMIGKETLARQRFNIVHGDKNWVYMSTKDKRGLMLPED